MAERETQIAETVLPVTEVLSVQPVRQTGRREIRSSTDLSIFDNNPSKRGLRRGGQ